MGGYGSETKKGDSEELQLLRLYGYLPACGHLQGLSRGCYPGYKSARGGEGYRQEGGGGFFYKHNPKEAR